MLLSSARQRAKENKWQFTITEHDLEMPAVCPVFKVPMVRGTLMAPSIDRIDSTKGYIKGNVQIISRLANSMKSNATQTQLEQFAEWINKTKT